MLNLPSTTANVAFLPAQFQVTEWDDLEPYFASLADRNLDSEASLKQWLLDVNALQSALQEDLAWRYIRMTCNTQDEAATRHYQYFIEHISPKVEEWDNRLQLHYAHCPHRTQLAASDPAYGLYDLWVQNRLDLFREANIPLKSQAEMRAQEYGAIVGEMTVELDGKTLTLQQASVNLEDPDRSRRQFVWECIAQRRAQAVPQMDALLDELIALRTQIAHNAGFESYTDYKFRDLDRFDYGREACQAFHTAVEQVVKPICEQINESRRRRLGLDSLRPWDLSVDPDNQPALRPFTNAPDLVAKTIAILGRLKPELGQMIAQMEAMGHLDLESRVGKAPGGYNYPLAVTGVPFIFMNAVGLQGDLTTMVHEAGHAVHSFLTRQLPLSFWREVPSEVAELASMSMELITMDHWDVCYPNPEDLKRARLQQIERALTGLPWIACVDAFQTWLYDNPTHSAAERAAEWTRLYRRFHGHAVDYSGYTDTLGTLWQRQLHIYEVPFYYIEYGFAQMGAFQVWRNYRSNPQQGLEAYVHGLSLGYTAPIATVYQAADVRFDFSPAFMQEVIDFVRAEYEASGL
jgi:oligoendopeptidase F